MRAVLSAYEFFILVYFSALALVSALLGFLGMRSIVIYAREMSSVGLNALLERDFFKPVSILVPAYNEEKVIVASVQSLLDLEYPQFEVIVAADGPTDNTVGVLIEAFDLIEIPRAYRVVAETQPVRRVLRSVRYPNLFVVDKENGGKADTVNAAFNLASYPLVCSIDADSILDGRALARATRLFSEDDRVVAVGGTVRPLNGAELRNGKVQNLRVPKSWVERLQILEYARAFFTARAAWSRLDCLMIISGAFGIFRRDAVEAIGGWWTGTVADDMEIVVRLHRHHRSMGVPYRIVTSPDPICWTEVPSSLKALRRQRNGWQRGLWEVLLRHKGMFLNPRYGRVGMVGIPFLWIFEALAAFVELSGYVYMVVAGVLGLLNVPFAVMFFALAVLYAILLSELAMGVETLLLSRYERASCRLRLFVAAFVEFAGYRQVLLWERCIAPFQLRRRRGRFWTEGERSGSEITTSA
ncbi:MAG TPA: glycosyltransferase family 2 protein [Acidimicrobiales bacterium]|nr:glycosyltransferase family 2 protein [Acidimicrobiales bacterium]